MKNEGPFILEWLAYHRAIGFDSIVVGSNDCEDGSDVLLDALASEGFISHRRNIVPEGFDPQYTFLKSVFDHWMVHEADWIMVLDADEFFNISAGNGLIDDLLIEKPDADAIVVLWKTFGAADHDVWPGGLAIKQMIRCEENVQSDAWNRFHKTIFRNNGKFIGLDAHYPILDLNVAINDINIYNAEFSRYPSSVLASSPPSMKSVHALDALWTWNNACINHYPFKTQDLFEMKRYRGDNVPGRAAKKYVPGSAYHSLKNKNTSVDDSILKLLEQTEKNIAVMRSSKIVREAERNMLSAFSTLREKILLNLAST